MLTKNPGQLKGTRAKLEEAISLADQLLKMPSVLRPIDSRRLQEMIGRWQMIIRRSEFGSMYD